MSSREPHRWWKSRWAAGAVLAVVCVGAALDLGGIERHAHAGPFLFPGARCAGGSAGPAQMSVTDPAIGPADWPAFQGGDAHNVLLPAAPSGQTLAASWRFQTNGSVVTAPAVVGGVAYLGSMDGCVYALDAATGHLLWSFAANNQVMSEPIVADGRVFFGSGNKGLGTLAGHMVRGTGRSAVYALNAATGQEEWAFPTTGGNMPTLAYSDGVVYDVGGGQTFYALSAATGAPLWQVPVGSYDSMSSPVLVGDVAVFGGALPYALTGVNVATHQVAWRLPLPAARSGVDDVSPAAAGGVVFVQVPEGTAFPRVEEMAVRASDGSVLWRQVLGTDRLNLAERALGQGELAAHDGEATGIATVAAGRVYVGSPGLPGLWALDAATGAPIWRARLPQGIRAAPLVAGDRIYAVSDTRLFVLDAATGQLVGGRTLGTFHELSGILIPCSTPGPILVGDTLIVGAGDDSRSVLALPVEDAA